MKIEVIGANIDVGQSLVSHVEDNLPGLVTKYFEKALSAVVHFSKDGQLFKAVIIVNEGVKGGITVKSNAEAGDVYACFNEAAQKAAKQLRRYKRKIKNYRRHGGGLKSVEPSYKDLNATKYVLPPEKLDVFEEMESEENELDENPVINVIAEKNTQIEEMAVDQAIMKMNLADLPALAFINKDTKNVNFVYHRKDGNVSWINPQE